MIDLRSDTVTRPTAGMRKAIVEAEVGDDVWGDDPTVKRLEAQVAELLGKEAALFVTSGTQGNLCSIMAHCQRGEEYLVGLGAHCYKYEAGGAAVLGSVQPHPLPLTENGQFDLEMLAGAIAVDDPHFAPTRLLCIENTHDGKVLPMSYHAEIVDFASRHGLSLHLDGARLWNAAAELGVSPAEVATGFDTVSVCLSKGLGAPVGSVLAGSPELIARAYRARKMLGGALRQVGVLAAAGIYALNHNLPRIAEDHANAARLADGLSAIPGVTVEARNTNMVFVDLGPAAQTMAEAAEQNDILIRVHSGKSRMVCHLDVSTDQIDSAVKILAEAS